MEQYVVYLRKSRADAEAEARGEGETLARHERALLALAGRQRLCVAAIYREIVSGETIAARPVMRRLLAEVERGAWSGVLVMEVERLARGDTMDQGLVAQTFQCSDTKIITPGKTYDPSNEFDEEYFEFGLFMSRREYKTINRRLQRGRYASANEGKFPGSVAPFGYEKVKLAGEKGYTLAVLPAQAEIVRIIFSLFTGGGGGGRMGIQQIASRLNEMKVPPVRHDYWQKETIRDMLLNPVYAGKIRWGWRPQQKRMEAGQRMVSRPRSSGYILADGRHEAIVDAELFRRAQSFLADSPPAPVGGKKALRNPLAGLVVCGRCGRKMVLRRSRGKPDYIVCNARGCGNVGVPFTLLEARVLAALQNWVDGQTEKMREAPSPDVEEGALLEKAARRAKEEVETLEKQRGGAYDLLERGVYTPECFLARMAELSAREKAAEAEAKRLRSECDRFLARQKQRPAPPQPVEILSLYRALTGVEDKNELLKVLVKQIVYAKDASGCLRGVSPDAFHLGLFPRVRPGEAGVLSRVCR